MVKVAAVVFGSFFRPFFFVFLDDDDVTLFSLHFVTLSFYSRRSIFKKSIERKKKQTNKHTHKQQQQQQRRPHKGRETPSQDARAKPPFREKTPKKRERQKEK